MRFLFFTLSLIFGAPELSALAEEEATHQCLSLKELLPLVKTCKRNAYFALAAEKCIDKLEAAISIKKQTLALLMAANSAGTATAQNGRIENNSQNLLNLRASMIDLMRQAQQARNELATYTENFRYPGGQSREFIIQSGLDRLFRKFSCYKESYSAVAEGIGILNERIKEFQKVIDDTDTLQARTNTNLQRMDSGNGTLNRAVSNRAPASLGAPVAGTPPRPVPRTGQSTLTGTEKAGESDRALQRLTK